eukprot:scaffold110_cov19-Tisochrysis_lutea.AAC.1
MFGLVTEPSPVSSPGGNSIIAGIMMEHVRGGSLSQVSGWVCVMVSSHELSAWTQVQQDQQANVEMPRLLWSRLNQHPMPFMHECANMLCASPSGHPNRLRLRAQACQPFTLRERCLIALQAALGMAYLHDQHPAVIHFDLKPDNLLVEREGQDVLVKVADFGKLY